MVLSHQKSLEGNTQLPLPKEIPDVRSKIKIISNITQLVVYFESKVKEQLKG